jgi:hypothetical protein
MEPESSPQERALDLLSNDGASAVLSEPWALAALADPGQWAGDVERALVTLPSAERAAIRRAGRAVLKAGRAEAGMVVPFPGGRAAIGTQPALAQPLILDARGGCWIRAHGRYVSTRPEIAVVVLGHAGHVLSVPSKDGERLATYQEAMNRAGAVVERVVYTLGSAADRYDADSRTLLLACGAPDPALEPRYHPEVAQWLGRLVDCDDHRLSRLLDWLAASWRLQDPTCALYLQGPGSTGKSMLAQALQRCYGTTITTYADVVLGSYSAGIVRQPIVWLDERAPEDHHGRGTAAFRALIANRSHQYTEKYQASGTIQGCPRLVITANNDDALRFGREDLTRDDLEAIAIRILHLDVSAAAADYLATISTRGWVDDNGRPGIVCQHLAWLRDHHVYEAGDRLLVRGEVGDWLRRQSTQSGLAQDVLVAIVRALTDLRDAEDPVTREQPARHLVTVAQGHVLVGATDLHRAWPLLSGDRSGRVTVARLGRVLRGLAGHHRGTDRRDRRHPVPNDLIRDACRSIHGSDNILLDKVTE